jgi:hypothetical protein
VGKFVRKAQMPPMDMGGPDMDMDLGSLGAAPPAPMGMPPLGGPPMGGMPTMPAAAPGAPTDPEREEIGSPLDTLGKILYDVDAPTLIMQMAGTDSEDIASHIWELYGGNNKGGVDKSKIGAREPKSDVDPKVEKAEQKATEESRWLRLPKGKRINEITTLEELNSVIKGLVLNTVKNESKKGQAPGGMPGMPMANAAYELIRLAQDLDRDKLYSASDQIYLYALKILK